jgi:hypothetical protein
MASTGTTASSSSSMDVYQTEEGLLKLATYLRGVSGIKVKHAVEHERRVEFFKGQQHSPTVPHRNARTIHREAHVLQKMHSYTNKLALLLAYELLAYLLYNQERS